MNKKIILYRPSSGSEGVWFEDKFCSKCTKQPINSNDGGCNILLHMMCYDTDEAEYPQEVQLIGGIPTCLAFDSRAERERQKKERWNKFISKAKQYTLWGDNDF